MIILWLSELLVLFKDEIIFKNLKLSVVVEYWFRKYVYIFGF